MKKILSSVVALSFAVLSANALACPKGTALQGGTGPHHKGGKCISTTAKVKKETPKKQQQRSTQPMAPSTQKAKM